MNLPEYRSASAPDQKAEHLWDLLRTGIYFEDIDLFIPWSTAYKDLKYHEEFHETTGDRTNWYLGKHRILDGLEMEIEILQWAYQPDSSSFDQFYEFLGFDDDGYDKLLATETHLISLLGTPAYKNIENKTGNIIWEKGKVRIILSGWEHFANRYQFRVGLIDNSHERDIKQNKDHIIAQKIGFVKNFMENNMKTTERKPIGFVPEYMKKRSS